MKKIVLSVLFFAGLSMAQMSAQTCTPTPACDVKNCKPKCEKSEASAAVNTANTSAATAKACTPNCVKTCKPSCNTVESTAAAKPTETKTTKMK